MNKFKRSLCAVGAFALAALPALAADGEGGGGTVQETGINSANLIKDWVATAKDGMTNWGTNLAPLFGLGIGIVLLIIGWRLFKRVTKSAS